MIKRNLLKLKWFLKNRRNINPNSQLMDQWFGPEYPYTYNTDGLATCNNADFIKDQRFAKAYAAAAATNPWQGFTLQWRVYICFDFNSLDKKFYLLDTFEGFPIEQISDEEKKAGVDVYGGSHYKDVHQQVVETFKPFNVTIIKGRVPQTLEECTATKIAYLSIDMNAVAPEIAAADFFWDKIVKGGVILLDDYGFPMHINQKIAFDKFAAEKNVEILSLPTGQGIIIKNI
jgi:O-methyltransferase